MIVAPSVLACDFSRLGQEAMAMQAAGAEYLHLDVMDGHFVPNITFGAPVVKSLRGSVRDMVFDVHLMITHPLDYIDDFAAAGADIITFHLESDSPARETLARIRSHGLRPGLVLKPKTPAEALFEHLDKTIDMVLVMTVEPGFGGQKFMVDMMPKVRALYDYRRERGLSFRIQVDGGIDNDTAPVAAAHGADVLVAGSSLFSRPDYAAAVAQLRAAGVSGAARL